MILQLFLLILVFILAIVLYFELKRLKLSKLFKHIPGIQECPILGTKYVYNSKYLKLTELKQLLNEAIVSPLCKLFVGSKMLLVVSDPELVLEVTRSANFLYRSSVLKYLPYSNGMVFSEYASWDKVRRVVNPVFSQKAALSNILIFNEYNKKYEEEMVKRLDGPAFDLYDVVVTFTFDQIFRMTFGEATESAEELRRCVEESLIICINRLVTPSLYLDFIYSLTKQKHELDHLISTIDEVMIPELQKNLASHQSGLKIIQAFQKEPKSGEKLTFEEIYETCLHIIFAGYESQALSISNACLMLAMHPEIDAKVEAELREHYRPGDEIDHELLKRLPYLDMVYKEALRLFPPIPILPREALDDVEIEGIGVIPKGTLVGLVLYQLHRWKHVWGSDADQFNPDHFLPEAVEKRHPGSFMPFGGGPRACIGQQQAMISGRVQLFYMLSQFKFSTDLKYEDLSYRLVLTMHLNQKHMVRVHRRDLWK